MHQQYLTVTGRLVPEQGTQSHSVKVVEQRTVLESLPFSTASEAVMFALTNRPMMAFII